MTLSWFQIVRLGLVQMALGAIVVLTTSTLNRLMVVELVAARRSARPFGRRCTMVSSSHARIGGSIPTQAGTGRAGSSAVWWRWRWARLLRPVACLALEQSFALGLTVSIIAYTLIGLGVGASGTSLLALLATTTAPHRRAAAATITWLMMIFGIAMTAGIVGAIDRPLHPHALDRDRRVCCNRRHAGDLPCRLADRTRV